MDLPAEIAPAPALAAPMPLDTQLRQWCPLCKCWLWSLARYLLHMQGERHSANCLHHLRNRPMLVCGFCGWYVLVSIEAHCVSRNHVTHLNAFLNLGLAYRYTCNTFNYMRIRPGNRRPDSMENRALRFDAVADRLYAQHLTIHSQLNWPWEALARDEVEDEEEIYEVVEDLHANP